MASTTTPVSADPGSTTRTCVQPNPSFKTSSKGKETTSRHSITSVTDLTSYKDDYFTYFTSSQPDCNESNQQEVNSSEGQYAEAFKLKRFLRVEEALPS